MAEINLNQAILILGGTASLIIASGSRHVVLSDRIRQLAREWRDLERERFLSRSADSSGASDRQSAISKRQANIKEQILIFEWRCRKAVWALCLLYFTFGAGFLGLGAISVVQSARMNLPYSIGLACVILLASAALSFHIPEQFRASETIELEIKDVLEEPAASTKAAVATDYRTAARSPD